MAPRASLIVVNLDGREHLEAFLPTVAAQTVPAAELEVIVVDNGSSDDSLAFLQAHYPQVRVVANAGNEGFARANNQGAAIAGAPYLILVNNDMRLQPDFVEQLLAARAAGGPELACLAARILDWEGQKVDFQASGLAFDGKGFQLGYGEPADEIPAARPLLFACGGAMLVDREVYLAAGGLDEDYFAYGEDVDFGWRLWVMGYRVELAPLAVALHRHNGTSKRFPSYAKERLTERNALYNIIKNYDDASLARMLPAALLLAVKRAAVRSGLERAEWAFTTPAAPAPAPGGLKQAVKQRLYRLGRYLVRRFGPDATDPIDVRPMRMEAHATVVGIEDLIDHLPRLLEKRRWVQARRKRADGEIFALFELPYQPIEGRGGFIPTQAATLAAFEIPPYFEARLHADAPETQTPCEISS